MIENIEPQQIHEICLNIHNLFDIKNNESSLLIKNLMYLFDSESINYLNQPQNNLTNSSNFSTSPSTRNDNHHSSNPAFEQILSYVKNLCESYQTLNKESLRSQLKSTLIFYLYPIIILFGVLGNAISLIGN